MSDREDAREELAQEWQGLYGGTLTTARQAVAAVLTSPAVMALVADCTCLIPVAIAGYCPIHEPAQCPSRSNGTDGWCCAAVGPHDEHHNAAGDVRWGDA